MQSMNASPVKTSRGPAWWCVTVLGCVVIVVSALLSLISAISLLMLLAGSYGTQSATLGGFVTVVVLPPVGLMTGIGLLCRWKWAWIVMQGIVLWVVAINVHTLATARPTTTTTTSPSGVKTTTVASGPNYVSGPLIVVGAGALAMLWLPGVRRGFGLVAGRRAVAEPVVTPVTVGVGAAAAGPWPEPGHRATYPVATRSQRRALWLVVVVLVALAGGMGWLVSRGVGRGVTVWPARRASQQRVVSRQAEPVMFWTVIGLYGVVGLGAGAGAAWGVREARRLRVV